LGKVPQAFVAGSVAALLQCIDEGRQQQFAVSKEHGIEKGSERFGVGGQDRPPAEHDGVIVAALDGPDRNALVA
jgi:hypothetical protein